MALYAGKGTCRTCRRKQIGERMKIGECKNFSDVVYYQSKENPDRIFIHDVRSKRNYSFKDFNKIVEKTSNYLISLNVKPKDRITAVIENSPEFCFFYFATLRAGAIFNPMPFTSHEEEIKKNVNYVKPKVLLLDSRKKLDIKNEDTKVIQVPVSENREFEKSIKSFDDVLEKKVTIDENNTPFASPVVPDE